MRFNFGLTFSIIAIAAPTAARLSAVNNDFQAQVQELVETYSTSKVCQRGPGSTKHCSSDEFCKLNKASTCPSTKNRRFKGTCVLVVDVGCAAVYDPVW
jgi:hypothetical protein